MKKHHLFLLIVSLLLVASLAFPGSPEHSTIQPVGYYAFNMDDLPSSIVQGDTVYIKKSINPFSDTEKIEVSFEILQKIPGKQDLSIPYSKTPVLMKGENDDQPEPYYRVTFPQPGTYVIRFHPSTYYNTKSPIDHTIEVVVPTNKTAVRKIRDGEDGI